MQKRNNGNNMDVSILTVTHNNEEHVEDQIRSVMDGLTRHTWEHIVVDNASSDATGSIIREKFPHVAYSENKKNLGFPAANNQGAKKATGRFFLFLNPDVIIEKGSIDTIIDWMDANPDAGIVSVKLVNEDGTLNTNALPRRFPTVWNIIAIFFKLPHVFPRILGRYYMRDIDPEKEQEVDSVRGACMMLRRELYEQLGFAFDPRYFIWFEDVDTCREAKRLGWRVVYTPVISCVDRVGKSFEQKNFLWKQWQFFRSAVKYFWKWRI